jgi:hypothetical protein
MMLRELEGLSNFLCVLKFVSSTTSLDHQHRRSLLGLNGQSTLQKGTSVATLGLLIFKFVNSLVLLQ